MCIAEGYSGRDDAFYAVFKICSESVKHRCQNYDFLSSTLAHNLTDTQDYKLDSCRSFHSHFYRSSERYTSS